MLATRLLGWCSAITDFYSPYNSVQAKGINVTQAASANQSSRPGFRPERRVAMKRKIIANVHTGMLMTHMAKAAFCWGSPRATIVQFCGGAPVRTTANQCAPQSIFSDLGMSENGARQRKGYLVGPRELKENTSHERKGYISHKTYLLRHARQLTLTAPTPPPRTLLLHRQISCQQPSIAFLQRVSFPNGGVK